MAVAPRRRANAMRWPSAAPAVHGSAHPALARRAEAAEATVHTLEAHLADLRHRQVEAERERDERRRAAHGARARAAPSQAARVRRAAAARRGRRGRRAVAPRSPGRARPGAAARRGGARRRAPRRGAARRTRRASGWCERELRSYWSAVSPALQGVAAELRASLRARRISRLGLASPSRSASRACTLPCRPV